MAIGCIVVLTGKSDWISDGSIVIKLDNGPSLLGDITGSGCMAGTCVATFCAAACALDQDSDADARLVRGDMLLGAVGGLVMFLKHLLNETDCAFRQCSDVDNSCGNRRAKK